MAALPTVLAMFDLDRMKNKLCNVIFEVTTG